MKQDQPIQHDPVGMFGQKSGRLESQVEIEQTYADMRYQGLGEEEEPTHDRRTNRPRQDRHCRANRAV